MNIRKFVSGQVVRVEHSAVIVGLADKNNPYWYEVAYSDGRPNEVVSIVRLNSVNDHAYAVLDTTDGTIEVLSRRLSPTGALDLLLWLEIHRHDLEQARGQQTQPLEEIQPPDNA